MLWCGYGILVESLVLEMMYAHYNKGKQILHPLSQSNYSLLLKSQRIA